MFSKGDKVTYEGRVYRVTAVKDAGVTITQARVARFERRHFETVPASRLEHYDAKRAQEKGLSNASTCQICGRPIMANEAGAIAHHGYERPNHGWQTASCMGARHLRYEQSRELIPLAIEHVEMFIANQRAALAYLIARPAKLSRRVYKEMSYTGAERGYVLVDNLRVYEGKEGWEVAQHATPADRDYGLLLTAAIRDCEAHIADATMQRDLLQKRYDTWRPGKSWRDN